MRKLSAVLKILQFFVQGGGCHETLLSFVEALIIEERQLMKWVGIFQVGNFYGEIS